MEIPKKLYKYESFNELSLRNLKKQSVYFASPRGFNDPYDCAITAEIASLTSEQIEDFKRHYLDNEQIPSEVKDDIKRHSDQFISEKLKAVVSDSINQLRNNFMSNCGITCLSELNDDLLMWSHYGGKYKGFCLEFDSQYPPFTKSRRVKYSNEMPKIDPFPFISGEVDNQFMDLFCLKSESWQYEKEWRVFHMQAGTPFTYQQEALTGIYLGPDMAPECLEIIALIIKGQNENVKLFRGKRSTSAFKVEFEEINYTPHIVAKKLGLM